MLPSSLSNPPFNPFPNKTISHHHRKTRTAIFAYFRKRPFSAPKTHNFCQLTKTHDFHNLHHNICISPNPESESAENTFLPRKIRHFSCWQSSAIIACFAKRQNQEQYRNAPILTIQVNMKWLCCWQFLWVCKSIIL